MNKMINNYQINIKIKKCYISFNNNNYNNN